MIRALSLLAALALLADYPAGAELCATDPVPAASLLLPHFIADISDYDGNGVADCNGLDTFLSINNATDFPALAHMIFWTDWSFPTINVDVFLTGFDVQPVSICRLIGRGRVARTADEQNDPGDTISPHVSNATWDGSFPGCAGALPPGNLVTAALDYVQNALAGYPVPALGNQCAGEGLNGSGQCAGGSCPPGTIVRGYVTIDNVSQCSILRSPSDPGYFAAGGMGLANNLNQLWGDWFILDRANNFAQGDQLVHIEAHDDLDSSDIPVVAPTASRPLDPAEAPLATVANPYGYTFYGREVANGADNREPLAATWAVRHLDIAGGTQLIVWRDSKAKSSFATGYACGLCAQGAGPSWCPLGENQIVCWDEAEDAVELCTQFVSGGIVFDRPCAFDVESQLVTVGSGNFAPPTANGWCFLNFNTSTASPFDPVSQSHVSSLISALGRFSVGADATEMTSTCNTAANLLILDDLGELPPPP